VNKNKHENYEILNLIGYGLAKFNNNFINEFGYKTKIDFYEFIVSLSIAQTKSVVKNRQDLFDPFFENGRRGWWQKGETYIHRKYFIDSLFGELDSISYANIVKMYLQDKFEYKGNNIIDIKPIVKSQFNQLQKTGREAELYFLNNYKIIKEFENSTIQDTRLLGDGYDFQIDIKNEYFLAEVKGIRNTKGSIRLTNNEFNKAKEYKDRYLLSIVSNLNDVPKITIIPNPLEELKFKKNLVTQEQIQFNTKSIEW
jgi:hypothetical protein